MNNAIIADSLFPVAEVPAVLQDTHLGETDLREVSTGHKFIVREDTGQVLSCMTDEYRLVTNEELMSVADPLIKENGGTLREVAVLNDGRRSVWKYRFTKTKIELGKNDVVNPEVIIENSYDGSTEIRAISGAFRVVCSNGMVVGFVLSKTTNRHSIWNTNIDKMPEIIGDVVRLTNEFLVESLPALKDTKFRRRDLTEVIKLLPTYAMEPFVQYLSAHKPKNYWDILNACTFITTHHMRRDRYATHRLENKLYPKVVKLAQHVAQA